MCALRPLTGDTADEALSTDAAHPRRDLVYATLGTVYNHPRLLADIIEALADEPLDLVVTTGGQPYEGPVPTNTRVEPWIPQSAILPRCAAVVTHGGYGTVSATLGHGLPMVLLPISADQPINAQRVSPVPAPASPSSPTTDHQRRSWCRDPPRARRSNSPSDRPPTRRRRPAST